MDIKNKIIMGLFAILLGESVNAATAYAVPKEYTNVYKSIESKAQVVISNSSPYSSLATKVVAGAKGIHYRCLRVDKIPCRNGNPSISASMSDIMLLDPNGQLLTLYGYEVITEDVGSKWNVCAGAIGGYTWDESKMSSKMDDEGRVLLKHEYFPNKYNNKYHFFMVSTGDPIQTGSAKSHILVDVQQKCR